MLLLGFSASATAYLVGWFLQQRAAVCRF